MAAADTGLSIYFRATARQRLLMLSAMGTALRAMQFASTPWGGGGGGSIACNGSGCAHTATLGVLAR